MLLDFDRLGWIRWALCAVAILAGLYLLLPILFIVLLSFGSSRWLIFPPPGWTLQWYREFFSDPEWIGSILTSLKIAGIVTVLSVLFGLLAALAVTRGTFRGRSALQAFLLTPMILPVVVLAVALYALFLRTHLNGTLFGFIVAHLVIALPFSVIVIANSLVAFDRAIEDAAVVCGASAFQAKLRVTLPSIRLGLYAAAVFSFLCSWDEVVLAIFMASPSLQTFPVRIWTTLRQDLTPVIAAASSLVMLVTLTLLVLGGFAMRRQRR
jgi:putative spermidine/putrescine transport system permease protein